jgi:DNA-directed RNA polymerase subunit K/omega
MTDTKYEKARIIGARALQISMGAPFMIKLGKKELEEIKYNPVRIATMEYEKGIIPLAVVRPVPETRRKLKAPKAEEKKA